MEKPYHSTSLRYVDAGQLDKRVLDLDGLDVRNDAGDTLGDVDGFLVDATSGRPRYVVVDSGGWFSAKRFLVPVQHAEIDDSRRALRVDFDRETINRFPRLDEERFDAVTDEEARAYDMGVLRAREANPAYTRDVAPSQYEAGAMPLWWNADAWTSQYRERPSYDDTGVVRERVAAREADPSAGRAPAYGERAQPGDVLGIESSGETTSIGDTAADEDRRREDSEKYFEKNRRRE